MLEAVVAAVIAGVILLVIEHRTDWFRDQGASGNRSAPKKSAPMPQRSVSRNPNVSGRHIADAVVSVTFDDAKQQIIESMISDLRHGQLAWDEMVDILESFTFDSSKVSALRLLITKASKPIPGHVRVRILGTIQSSSSQADAARIMGNSPG